MTKKLIQSICICLLACLMSTSFVSAEPLSQASTIHYVKSTPTGSADCSSWENACGLQTALDKATFGGQIWVAEGTYKPTKLYDLTQPSNSTNPRSATFNITRAVAIYGGFPADGGDLDTRDPAAYPTILSGDIGVAGEKTDNSYHVVVIREANGVSLDGFTIRDGYANGSGLNGVGGGMYSSNYSPTLSNTTFSNNFASGNGGGMCNHHNNPTLFNVVFSGNQATNYGGGMYNYNFSKPILTNVSFFRNEADRSGGGMYNFNSSPILTNVTFYKNKALDYGSGMHNYYSSNPTLTNVTFSSNNTQVGGTIFNQENSNPSLFNVTFTENFSGSNYGSAIYNYKSSPTLTNAIVWGNTPTLNQIYNGQNASMEVTYSDIQGDSLYPGNGNINKDPLLASLADNGGYTQTHALGAESPAIGAANPATCPATDQRGHPRLADSDGTTSAFCDIGAYEFGYTLTAEVLGGGSVELVPDRLDYYSAEVVSLTANPEPGWTFTGWSGDASGTDNPLAFNVTKDSKITATFTQNEYSLTVLTTGAGSVNIAPQQGTYHYGDLVTLTANPAPDWAFTGWSGSVSGTENPLVVTIDGDKTITARFEQTLFRYILVPIYK